MTHIHKCTRANTHNNTKHTNDRLLAAKHWAVPCMHDPPHSAATHTHNRLEEIRRVAQ